MVVDIEEYLATMTQKGRDLDAPAPAMDQLAHVRHRVRRLIELRGISRGLALPDQPDPQELTTVAEVFEAYKRLVAALDQINIDPVVTDYLWSWESRLSQLLEGGEEHRLSRREPEGREGVLYGPNAPILEEPVPVHIEDRSLHGFGVWLAEEPKWGSDELIRLVVEDPVGYECFVVYSRPEGGGWRVGLEFAGAPGAAEPVAPGGEGHPDPSST